MIYILCPANIKTGGTELLHQLVYELYTNNIKAQIVYIIQDGQLVNIPDEFTKYTQDYLILEQIIDCSDNVLIVPEIYTYIPVKYKNICVYIWWLSVDHYMIHNFNDLLWHYKIFSKEYGVIKEMLCLIKRSVYHRNSSTCPVKIQRMNKNWNHLVQSHYAWDFLKKHGISHIQWLSDYINVDYLAESQLVTVSDKENYVAYNPCKGLKFTRRLISYSKDIKFVPIVNMSNAEVKDCLKKAKVYIDFGSHPGKDRIPREAACMHCCVITGRRGSAMYCDVPISSEFKIKGSNINIKKIHDLIKDIFLYYEKYDQRYDIYREKIFKEKPLFEKNVKDIFSL